MWQPVTYVSHTEVGENKIELCDLKRDLLSHPNITNEPCHEIMVRFALLKRILQTRMRSHSVGLDV